jgi:hypothetical protein
MGDLVFAVLRVQQQSARIVESRGYLGTRSDVAADRLVGDAVDEQCSTVVDVVEDVVVEDPAGSGEDDAANKVEESATMFTRQMSAKQLLTK